MEFWDTGVYYDTEKMTALDAIEMASTIVQFELDGAFLCKDSREYRKLKACIKRIKHELYEPFTIKFEKVEKDDT